MFFLPLNDLIVFWLVSEQIGGKFNIKTFVFEEKELEREVNSSKLAAENSIAVTFRKESFPI